MADSTVTEATDSEDARQRAEIDRSVRLPVLFFFTSGLVWLFIASILGLVSSMKLHNPEFLGDGAWLSYGRSMPAHQNAFLYGWMMQAGFGASIWIMARLCRVPLRMSGLLLVVGHVWNLAVAVGVGAILLGHGTSIEWLDFPAFLWPVLFICYALIAASLVVMFKARRDGHVYISQWYLLAAIFWFPWVYSVANLLIHHFPSSAVMGAAIDGWYVSTFMVLWMAATGLAATYYFVPKIVGRAIYSYQVALGGFWGLAILGGWTGVQVYMGGPLPAWMPAVSGAATIFLLIPMTAIAINHHRTIKGSQHLIQYSPTLRFTSFGAFFFSGFLIVGAALCFYTMAKATQFTLAETSQQVLGTYCFFTMVMFGAMYFIIPRLVQCEWRSGGWIRFHFWFSAYGSICIAASLLLGGIDQGAALSSAGAGFRDSIEVAAAYAVGRSVGWLLIILSNFVFIFHVLLMILRLGRRSTRPTLIHEPSHDLNEGGAHA